MVEGVLGCGHQPADEVHEDHLEQDGGEIVSRSAFHISSGRIEGVNGFIKALRRSAFGYQDFDYFALLIWEQTHKDVLYGRPHCKGPRKAYSRKSPYNRKRLKQTVFLLPADGCKEAM